MAKWFGVCRGERNEFYFEDTDRLTNVINDSWTKEFPDQFPSIVSFVGQTGKSYISLLRPPYYTSGYICADDYKPKGDGNSTIIQMLIALQQYLTDRDELI